MNVLVIGSGGREHAICAALSRSLSLNGLFCAPGNAGIAGVAKCVPIEIGDHHGIAEFCRSASIDFVVVGPEEPLVAGLVDFLEDAGIETFGPRQNAAILEGSKVFTKLFCGRHGIPTAQFATSRDADEAKKLLRNRAYPVVIKVDGLAAGKGVVIAQSEAQAIAALDDALLDMRFGEAGCEIVLEEFMTGVELSVFALVDGETILPFATAQDYKRAFDGDQGPNTGGMGARSPALGVTAAMESDIYERIIHPTVEGMRQEGRPFSGLLYAGVMVTSDGPKLIEYNVRFGDPECQAILERLNSELLPLLIACRQGRLSAYSAEWSPDPAVCVVMASKGYPNEPRLGSEICVIPALAEAKLYHSSTVQNGSKLIADGGRVLNVVARGATYQEARDIVYRGINSIDWPGGFFRNDIGA